MQIFTRASCGGGYFIVLQLPTMKHVILQTIIYGLISGAALVPLVISFNLIYGTSRVFHFPHATLCLSAVYAASAFSYRGFLPVWMALLLGVFLACAISMTLVKFLYLPLIKRGASEVGLVMAALGLFLVLEHLIPLGFSSDPRMFLGSDATKPLLIGDIRLTHTQVFIMLGATASILALRLIMRYTRLGLHSRAYSDSAVLARSVGIPEKAVLMWVFGFGTAIGAVTMISRVAYSGILSPEESIRGALAAAACSTFFGVRRPLLGVVAALILGVGQEMSGFVLGARWQDAFALTLLVVGLSIRRRMPLEA